MPLLSLVSPVLLFVKLLLEQIAPFGPIALRPHESLLGGPETKDHPDHFDRHAQGRVVRAFVVGLSTVKRYAGRGERGECLSPEAFSALRLPCTRLISMRDAINHTSQNSSVFDGRHHDCPQGPVSVGLPRSRDGRFEDRCFE